MAQADWLGPEVGGHLHLSDEPGKLSQWQCTASYDNSTINIVVPITITITIAHTFIHKETSTIASTHFPSRRDRRLSRHRHVVVSATCNCDWQVKRCRSKGGLAGVNGIKSVFGQLCSRISLFGPESLMLPHRIWKVKFIGSLLVCSLCDFVVISCKRFFLLTFSSKMYNFFNYFFFAF